MWEWLAGLPWLASTIIVGLFLASAGLLLFLIVRVISAGSFDNGKIKFRFTKSKAPTYHFECPNVGGVLELFHDYEAFYSFKHEVEFIRILSDQMRESENFLQSCYDLLLTGFIDLLKKKKGSDINLFEQIEYKTYVSVLTIERSNARALLRRYFKENHLVEKNEKEFEEYKKERINQIVSTTKTFFAEHYFSTIFSPTANEVIENSLIFFNKIEGFLEKSFERSREIASEYYATIDKKKKDLDEKYKTIFGKYPSS